jgi:hypothetical protein
MEGAGASKTGKIGLLMPDEPRVSIFLEHKCVGQQMSDEKFSPKEILESAANHLRSEFEEIKKNNPHSGESGAEAEIILSKFLKDHLPRRFEIGSGFVLGPGGSLSRQTDLIIFDALDSPVYRRGPRVQIIPRDCVAAVIEVKSKLNKDPIRSAAAGQPP